MMISSKEDRYRDGDPRRVPPLMAASWESATSDPDPLIALGATRALIGLLSTWEAQLATEAVASGATWEAVGSSVGVSRQAAWERFHSEVADFKRQVKAEARALKDRHKQEIAEFRDEIKKKASAFRWPHLDS
jgi:hypothetical protein